MKQQKPKLPSGSADDLLKSSKPMNRLTRPESFRSRENVASSGEKIAECPTQPSKSLVVASPRAPSPGAATPTLRFAATPTLRPPTPKQLTVFVPVPVASIIGPLPSPSSTPQPPPPPPPPIAALPPPPPSAPAEPEPAPEPEPEPDVESSPPPAATPDCNASEKQSVPIDEQEYYHGLLPRDDVISLLTTRGDYLVRSTEITSGANRQYCLSIAWNGTQHHFILGANDQGLYSFEHGVLGAAEFPTIVELISYHQKSRRPFSQHNIILLNPIYRQEWELRHTQIQCTKKLGEGAFGEVYSGLLTLCGKKVQVAIKQMKCSILTKQKIEELMKEARLMRPLRHKNVVRFYGVAAETEPLLIIMELVQGGALDGHLRKNGPSITIQERLNMCADAALGIEYIHAKGMVHRDIAARNCLYGNKSLKISDFGLSRKAESVKLDPTEKAPIRWIAPEVFLTQTYTPAADVWAFGILVWEIFTNGMDPYTGWTGQQLRDQIIMHNYRLEFPSWAPPSVSFMIKLLVWHGDPKSRMKSATVAREFEKLTNRPPQAAAGSQGIIGRKIASAQKTPTREKNSKEQQKSQKGVTNSREVLKSKKSTKGKEKKSEMGVKKEPKAAKESARPPKKNSTEQLNKLKTSSKRKVRESDVVQKSSSKSRGKNYRHSGPSKK